MDPIAPLTPPADLNAGISCRRLARISTRRGLADLGFQRMLIQIRRSSSGARWIGYYLDSVNGK